MLDTTHGRSRMAIYPRIPTTPGRSTSDPGGGWTPFLTITLRDLFPSQGLPFARPAPRPKRVSPCSCLVALVCLRSVLFAFMYVGPAELKIKPQGLVAMLRVFFFPIFVLRSSPLRFEY